MNAYRTGQLVSYTSSHGAEYGIIVASHAYEKIERYEHQDELVVTYQLAILWPDGVLKISTAPLTFLQRVLIIVPQLAA